MRMPSVKLSAVFLTACALAGPASPRARADFINHFTGNVQMSDHTGTLLGKPPTPQGDVSFTVYDNRVDGGNPDFRTALGLSATTVPGSAALDTHANYIYMYQAFTLKGFGPIEDLQISASPGLFTSAGYLTGSKNVFNDGANVGTTANPTYGATPTLDDVAGDHNPATIPTLSGFTDQGVPVKFGSNTAARLPDQFSDNSGTSGFVVFDFHVTANKINSEQTSVVLILTSKFGPTYDFADIHDGGTSEGDAPTALTPEPGSFVLCGLGVGLLGFYGWRRRGLNAQPAVA